MLFLLKIKIIRICILLIWIGIQELVNTFEIELQVVWNWFWGQHILQNCIVLQQIIWSINLERGRQKQARS